MQICSRSYLSKLIVFSLPNESRRHRQPETWWTENANYSDYAEEVIGLREILLKYGNGGASNGPLNRDNVIGMRAPYIKPGGDAMFEMAHDFGLAYDTSLVAPKANLPFWPFT